MTARYALAALLLLIAGLPHARGQEAIPEISESDLARLLTEIKPQPGESPWREISWLTSVTEARRRAIAEDKPIVIFGGRRQSAVADVRGLHREPGPVVHRAAG
jgi:hypothetical protein